MKRKPLSNNQTTLRLAWLLPFFRPYYRHFALILTLAICSVILSLSYPFFAKVLIDDVFIHQRYSLWLVIGFGLLAGLLGTLIQVGNGYYYLSISLEILRNLRLYLFSRVQRLPQDFFLKTKVGDITTRINGDLAELQGAITDTLLQLVSSILTLLFITGVLLWVDWKLFIFALLSVPILVGSLNYFRPKVMELTRQIRISHSDIQAHLVETFANIRLIKLSVAEQERTGQLDSKIIQLNRQTLRFTIVQSLAEGIPRLAVTLSIALVLLVGGYKVLSGALSLGSLFAFTAYLSRFFQPVQSMAGIYLRWQRAWVSLERISDYLEQPAEESAALTNQETIANHEHGLLSLKQVSSYSEGQPIIQNVHFTLNPGETMALLGPSGIGKSTLIDVIVKLRPIQEGQIYVQGKPIELYSAQALRQFIAVVSQEVAVLQGSIRDNLLLGLSEEQKHVLTDAELRLVCQLVGLDDYIATLPEGYDTQLGHKGDRFSGGQKQRLAIARALLREPNLLILDEATSGLDEESERQIYRSLRRWVKQEGTFRGLLIVTHRHHAIDWVDEVYWLNQKANTIRGSHVG